MAPSGGVGHEILTEDTGVCTAGGVQSWTMSLRRALELAADAHTAERCRARAAEFDWSRRADSFEALYRRLAA